MTKLEREEFSRTRDGQQVERFTLSGPRGLKVRLITFGATITELWTPDRHGNVDDVVLGFDDLGLYETKSPYFGCTVGRVAFRIPYGRFELDGRTYQLTLNNGQHHLHGGTRGFSWRNWQARPLSRDGMPAVKFTLRSPDGDQGYPGQVDVTAIYTLTDAGELRIEYTAVTDRPTPINLTHHSYFNFAGAGSRDVLQHVVQVEADKYSETDADTIPTGVLLPVADTPFDFRHATPIGQRVGAGQLDGYDLAYLLRDKPGTLRLAASLHEPSHGRAMEVLTDAPALIFYTGNYLDGSLQGKHGYVYKKHSGLCLETGNLPDAVHHANFPPIILRPGQTYRHTCVYRFTTKA